MGKATDPRDTSLRTLTGQAGKTWPGRVPDVAWAPGVRITLCHSITTIG